MRLNSRPPVYPVAQDQPVDVPAQRDDGPDIPADVRDHLAAHPRRYGHRTSRAPITWGVWVWVLGMIVWWPLGIGGALHLLWSWKRGYRGITAGCIGLAAVGVLLIVNAHIHPPLF